MGYQRIKGELQRLDVHVSTTAIRTTLRRHGLDPPPQRKLEVADQPPTAWQRAILQGYEVWRWLRQHDGIVEGDLDRRSLRFVAPA